MKAFLPLIIGEYKQLQLKLFINILLDKKFCDAYLEEIKYCK